MVTNTLRGAQPPSRRRQHTTTCRCPACRQKKHSGEGLLEPEQFAGKWENEWENGWENEWTGEADEEVARRPPAMRRIARRTQPRRPAQPKRPARRAFQQRGRPPGLKKISPPRRRIRRPRRLRRGPLIGRPAPVLVEPSSQSSEFVRWVQHSLNQVMGLHLLVKGIMNLETRAALRAFQRQNGLPEDGIVGPETKQALIAARKKDSTTTADRAPSADNDRPPQEEYFISDVWNAFTGSGSASSQVNRNSRAYIKWVQRALNQILGLKLSIDGISGAQTRSAVRSFQRRQGLTVDGIVGERTEAALVAAGAGKPPRTSVAGTVKPPTPSNGARTDNWVLPNDIRVAGEAQSIRYDSPPPWENGKNCTGSLTPGAVELRDHIRATFGGVSRIGGYNCRPNSANRAETSVHGTGRALDIMITPVNNRANRAVGDPIANWLVQNAEAIGVQYIIWNRTRWSGSRRGRKDRDYGGPNPHIDHIHVELNRDGATRRTPWFARKRR